MNLHQSILRIVDRLPKPQGSLGNVYFLEGASLPTVRRRPLRQLPWRTGPTPGAPLTYAGRVGLTFPGGSEHTTYALAARPALDAPFDVDVYFNIGAAANSVATSPSSTVGLSGSGLTSTPAAVVTDAIHRVRVSDSEAGLAVSAPQQIARGLRNAAGMTFDAGGGLAAHQVRQAQPA